MPTLQESLRCFLAVEGLRTAALIDIATGMIVRSVGRPTPDLATTAACVADEARAARNALGDDRPADDLVEITTVTRHRLHLSRVLRHSPGAGLLLFVELDRDNSNLGAAVLRVDQLAPAVMA